MAFLRRALERLTHQRLRVDDDDSTVSVAEYSLSFAGALASFRSNRDSLRDHELHFLNCGDDPELDYINSSRIVLENMANKMVAAARGLESLEKAYARKEKKKQKQQQQGRGLWQQFGDGFGDSDEEEKQHGRGLWQQYGDGFGDSDDDHVY